MSSVEQAQHGYGLDTQRTAIRSAARTLGARVVKFIADPAVSGALPAEDRPGLTEALSLVRSGQANGVIVRDLDRLARAVTVQEAILAEVWNRLGGRVFTATGEVPRDDPDDPMRTAMREMAGVFAGLERRMIVKRLRDGRAAKARTGGHAVGPAPFGHDAVNGELASNPVEQAALRLMRKLAAGGASTRDIADALTAEGHPTKRGGVWSSATVARILARNAITTHATARSTDLSTDLSATHRMEVSA